MLSRTILSALAAFLVGINAAPTPQKRDISFNYNSDKVRGVNLGGWFVLEPWITPSLFQEWADSADVKDEYTYSQMLGKDEAYSRLNNHWNSWIMQDDFNAIAAAGMNHVRIPIGYWALNPLDGDPYVQGQLDVLDKAIGWASSAGLKVMLDLHGAPGSQNGFDNSGRFGPVDWQNIDPGAVQTKNAITNLAERYLPNYSSTVTMIELINEPMGSNNALNMDDVKKYYYDGWGTVRDSNGDTVVVIHDAFQDPQSYWNGFMNTQSGVNNVLLDTHQYQVFSNDQVSMSPSSHVSAACALGPKLAQTDKWTVVGEWTGAQTDCAKWLNGLGIGARYDGTFAGSSYVGSCDGKYTGTAANLSSDDKKNLRSYVEAQLDAYEQHTGWIFWNWKTESAPEWDLQGLIQEGLFPQPLTDRQYPNQCA